VTPSRFLPISHGVQAVRGLKAKQEAARDSFRIFLAWRGSVGTKTTFHLPVASSTFPGADSTCPWVVSYFGVGSRRRKC